MSETYKMNAKCLNCGTEFDTQIEKGKEARYHDACPYCGADWWWNFTLTKPIDLKSIQDDAFAKAKKDWGLK
jgi:DNA-directed RNA polymerase subunit RPC12/RpoP